MRAPKPAIALLAALALSGCSNPDAASSSASESEPTRTTASAPSSQGEGPAPAPPTPATQAPARVQSTPQSALSAFAGLYVNWSYRTLSAEQRSLAAISVGVARLAEEQAAAAAEADMAINRGHIHNSGQVVGIAADLSQRGTWIVITREQTGGSATYEGLPSSYHVTLARVAQVPGGYAVSEWLPQS